MHRIAPATRGLPTRRQALATGATALAEAASQTNTEKALALIGTFASGDSALAASLLDEGYIQHNSGIAAVYPVLAKH